MSHPASNQSFIDTLYADFEKLYDEFATYKSSFDSDIAQLLEECQSLFRAINSDADACSDGAIAPEMKLRLLQLQSQLKRKLTDTSKQHRELHAPLSKMGKLIDRSFISELPSSLALGQIESDRDKLQTLNTGICEQLIREGAMEVAQELMQESGLDCEAAQLSGYAALNQVVESLSRCELEPALRWLEDNRGSLGSDSTRRYLEFLIRRLQLLQLVAKEGAKPEDVLCQARLLAAHSPACDQDIRRLMGSLAFVRTNLHKSPYKDLFSVRLYHELSQQLVSEANKMLGFSKELPLTVAVQAGCAALPPLLNIQTVMSQRNLGTGISGELPIDIDLGAAFHYHSVFACPILRTQTSDTNPPVRLVCGHAISKDAVAKLANANAKFKCPYCPMEMEISQVQDIHF